MSARKPPKSRPSAFDDGRVGPPVIGHVTPALSTTADTKPLRMPKNAKIAPAPKVKMTLNQQTSANLSKSLPRSRDLAEPEEELALLPANDDCMGCGGDRENGKCTNPDCDWLKPETKPQKRRVTFSVNLPVTLVLLVERASEDDSWDIKDVESANVDSAVMPRDIYEAMDDDEFSALDDVANKAKDLDE